MGHLLGQAKKEMKIMGHHVLTLGSIRFSFKIYFLNNGFTKDQICMEFPTV